MHCMLKSLTCFCFLDVSVNANIVTMTMGSLQGNANTLSATSPENCNYIEQYKMIIKLLSVLDSAIPNLLK